MSTITSQSPSSELQQIKAKASQVLIDFDRDTLQNTLFCAAGKKLSQVAASSNQAVTEQIQAIRQSVGELDSVCEGMDLVHSNVRQIDANVETVVQKAHSTSEELTEVSEHVQVLEGNLQAISGLVTTINRIADKTNLLALNATIEAARAGAAGKGFSVVANEVKELSRTTKIANNEITETLGRVTESVAALSGSVERSVEKIQQSVTAVEVTRDSAAAIGAETTRFEETLQYSIEKFRQLDQSSAAVENEVNEIDAISTTLSHLIERMSSPQTADAINPVERLLPLVQTSSFRDPTRFSQPEPEYVLERGDVLISATDTRGMITFANNSFYEVSEFEPGELVGRPHNLVRHPDMPRTAFADLWSSVSAGKMWQGLVANRSKGGRLYWVMANVFPCFENGQIVGYISLRTKPDKSLVAKAIEAYRMVP